MNARARIDIIQNNGRPALQFVGASFTKEHLQRFLGRLKRGEILAYDVPNNMELSTCDITDIVGNVETSLQWIANMRTRK